MNPGNDNQVDWTAAGNSHDGVAGSLSRPAPPRVEPRVDHKAKRDVMDTLLGENNLAAFEIGGNDPYNATGRQFRR